MVGVQKGPNDKNYFCTLEFIPLVTRDRLSCSLLYSLTLGDMLASDQHSDDPLDEALRPPPNENPMERQMRLAREEEARQVSEAIDLSIKAERQAMRRRRIVRLLLLGQSESGEF